MNDDSDEILNGCAGESLSVRVPLGRQLSLSISTPRGHKKAIVAVAHSILVAAYYNLRDEAPYHELGGDYFVRRKDQERLTGRLVRQLERLGQRVTLEPALEAR